MEPAFSDSLIKFLLIAGNISEEEKEYPKNLPTMSGEMIKLMMGDSGAFSMQREGKENLAVESVLESTNGHIFVVKEFPLPPSQVMIITIIFLFHKTSLHMQ